jgi:hypothetical protein
VGKARSRKEPEGNGTKEDQEDQEDQEASKPASQEDPE